MEQFYTYLWLRENGTPYYVGKGKGNRAYVDHWLKGKVRRVPPKECIIVYPAESEDDALETESSLIWYYGCKDLGLGCLRNLTNGGENPPNWKGKKRSRHHHEAMVSQAKYRKPPNEETRKKMAEAKIGKIGFWSNKKRLFSKIHRENLGKAAKGRTLSIKGKPWSEARRAAQNRRYKNEQCVQC